MTNSSLWRGTSNTRRLPRIIASAALMLGVLCFLLVLANANFRNLTQAHLLSAHTYEVIGEIDALAMTLDSHESRLRGFALTAQPEFLNEAEQIKRNGLQALQNLQAITRDNPQQLRRVEAFAVDYKSWLANFTVVDRDSLSTSSARVKAETVARREALRHLRSQATQMHAVEELLLQVRSQDQTNSQQSTSQLLLFASICAALVQRRCWLCKHAISKTR